MLHLRSSISAVFAAFVASLLLCGCSSVFSQAGGSRPFVYKQGPADPPETIQEKAGIVSKRDEPAAPPVRTAAAPAQAARPAAAAPAAAAPAAAERPTPAPVFQQPPASAPAPAGGAVADSFGGYTQASRYGDLLFISGQIGMNLRTNAFDASGDVESQTRAVMENLRTILENNRLTMANLLSVTVYLANINHLTAIDRVYHGFFKGTPPARTVVEVAHLPRGALVEISAVAGR